jgi:hypothetical protein
MPDNAVERLFSLFAASDRAEALTGDLAEERQQRGWAWYWFHVMRITLTLWRSATTEAPLSVVALMLAACALFTAPALGGLAAVYLVPRWTLSWMALPLFWWGGALGIGALLVTIAPRRGMPACASVAVGAAVLLLAFDVSIEPQVVGRTDRVFFTTALGTTMALLAGSAIARRRMIACGIPTLGSVR